MLLDLQQEPQRRRVSLGGSSGCSSHSVCTEPHVNSIKNCSAACSERPLQLQRPGSQFNVHTECA
eukprot:scaffold84800_cov66-Phaeocystis_antarctica.AAC.8